MPWPEVNVRFPRAEATGSCVQVVVSCLVRVMGMELRPSARAASALNHCLSSPTMFYFQLEKRNWYLFVYLRHSQS